MATAEAPSGEFPRGIPAAPVAGSSKNQPRHLYTFANQVGLLYCSSVVPPTFCMEHIPANGASPRAIHAARGSLAFKLIGIGNLKQSRLSSNVSGMVAGLTVRMGCALTRLGQAPLVASDSPVHRPRCLRKWGACVRVGAGIYAQCQFSYMYR